MASAKVYIIKAGEAYKIGVSEHPEYRMAQLQPGCPMILKLILIIDGGYGLESRLHSEFKHQRLHGEWFRLFPQDIMNLKMRFGERCTTPSLEPAIPYIRSEEERRASAEMALSLTNEVVR